MVQKRSFDDEETHEVSCKVPRQVESCDQMALFSEYDNSECAPRIPDTTGEDDYAKREGDDNPELNKINRSTPPVNLEDPDDPLPGNHSISSFGNSSASEEDILLEAPFPASFFPEYFFPEHRAVARYEEIYSILLEHPPQKQVPVGPDHQADIPEWSPQEVGAYLNETSSRIDDDVNKFAGTCVIPMPDLEASEEYCDRFGSGRCNCQHKGSIFCVRLHVWEAGDRLVRTIGLAKFIDLGFFDMGEKVAEKWTKDEEKLFHERVLSNPSLIGKNFWNALSVAFPSRTKSEIVSYYFNVFMLRKRAEQNRCDPINVDSDNDEWQASEEEDSVVESPVYDDIHSDSHLEDDINGYEDVRGEVCDDHENTSPGSNMGRRAMLELRDNKLVDDTTRHHSFADMNKTWDDRGEQGTQDDSCTSSDTGIAVPLNHVKNGSGNCRSVGFSGMDNGTGHDYVIDTCKSWDSGYVASRKKEDFLPTCMIEEVFRDGSLNCKTDGKSS